MELNIMGEDLFCFLIRQKEFDWLTLLFGTSPLHQRSQCTFMYRKDMHQLFSYLNYVKEEAKPYMQHMYCMRPRAKLTRSLAQ